MLHAFSRKHRNLSIKVLVLWVGALAVLLLELRDILRTLGLASTYLICCSIPVVLPGPVKLSLHENSVFGPCTCHSICHFVGC